MDKYELITKALELYRETKLQNDVVDMVLAEYTVAQWDRRDIYNLCKDYATIERIIKALHEANDMIRKYSSMHCIDETDEKITPDMYNDIVSRYNELYFKLFDICS